MKISSKASTVVLINLESYTNATVRNSLHEDTGEGMREFADNLERILDGFTRLKAENCRQFMTTMVEPFLSPTIKAGWSLHTENRKDIPSVEELMEYLVMKAAQAPEAECKPSREKGRVKAKAPHHKFKGSTNAAVTPAVHPIPTPPLQGKGTPSSSRAPFYQCRYTCLMCSEQHYPYNCKVFESYSLAQRKDHVKKNNLCTNCLKPRHTAAECQSTFRCKYCNKNHSSLLHEDRSPAVNSGQVAQPANAATHSATSDAPAAVRENLLMTSQVILTGPSGISLAARALLDSGSILSTKAMKTLSLRKMGSSVCIEGVGAVPTTNHPMAQVTLTSNYTKNW